MAPLRRPLRLPLLRDRGYGCLVLGQERWRYASPGWHILRDSQPVEVPLTHKCVARRSDVR